MTGPLRRALCAVAGTLALAGAAHATAPVATAFAPLSATGATTVDFSRPFDAQAFTYGPPAVARGEDFSATTSVSLLGGFSAEVGYRVDLAGRIAPVDTAASHGFDGLFLSSASAGSPYVALSSGGDFLGAQAALTQDLRVSAGFASLSPANIVIAAPDARSALARLGNEPMPYDLRGADTLLAGISWDPAKWASFGLTASHTSERDGILANPAPGANASTTALGLQARLHFGGGWETTASYSEGITQLDVKPGFAPALTGDALRTRSYGIAIAKNGLFGDDTLGVAVSRPALGADGGFVTMPGVSEGTSFFARNHLLEGPAPETDVEIGYITTFLDGSLALQTNASFQMNYAGQTGQNAVSLLSRARIKF